jgi:protein TonB
MYAEHRYAPQQSRAVSFGAAFAINGALIAGLILAAPEITPKPEPTVLKTENIPLELAPPEKPKEQPKIEPEARRDPPIYVPDTPIRTETDNSIRTTNEPPLPPLPPYQPPAPTGDPIVAEPPAPMPPLIGAEQDGRFARDFQPGYPSIELRAQRDGVVRIKVLIGTDGRVKAAQSVSATSDAFFDATRRQALSKWRFKPATRGGVPQESWKTLTVRFELANQ